MHPHLFQISVFFLYWPPPATFQCIDPLPTFKFVAPRLKKTSGYMAVLPVFIGWMPFLAPTLDNADPLFALVITPVFHLHLVEVVADQVLDGSLAVYNQTTRTLYVYFISSLLKYFYNDKMQVTNCKILKHYMLCSDSL